MKNTTFLLVALFALLFSSCSKNEGYSGNVKVRFTNSSSYNLTNVKVQNRIAGNLNAGATSGWINFDQFSFDSGYPAENVEVVRSGQTIIQNYATFCYTEYRTITTGNYDITIDSWQNLNGVPIVVIR